MSAVVKEQPWNEPSQFLTSCSRTAGNSRTGIAAENSLGVSRLEVGTPDLDITSTIDVDLAKTGNYNVLNEEGTEFAFNGAKDYNKINAPSSSKTSKLSKAVKSSATSALKNSFEGLVIFIIHGDH